ncbi:MAG: ABC transporter permease [Bacteroidales bacterium]|nr:ABC transporter permease [Bacteroidales bacterium]MBR5907649.1 ABC transporter permease [Bacteroidales bacterium]
MITEKHMEESKMSKIGIIISREYSTRVKKKSFIISTFLVPFLLAMMIVVPMLIAMFSSDNKTYNIAVSDESGVVAEKLENSKTVNYTVIDPATAEDVRKDLAKSDAYYGLLKISPLDSLNNAEISIYANEQVNLSLKNQIQGEVNDILSANKLTSYDIPNLDDVLKNMENKSSVKTFQVKENEEEEKQTEVGAYMVIGYISSFLIYMFIFMFGGMVMQGVIEEKNNRIIEVIVSSVKPMQLMIGKIVGIALVALTQFAAWIVLTFLIVTGVTLATGGSKVMDNAAQVQNVTMGMGGDAAAVAMDEIAPDNGEDSSPMSVIGPVLNTLKSMNIIGIVVTFLLYFILGYLLYASMFAAVGACVDNQADTQSLMLPITIPLIIGLFIMLSAFQNPHSTIAVWGSIIPFTSPMVMVARFAYGVPMWQYFLSLALLFGTFLFMGWVSSKIYRIGILSYGKKAGWKDIFKWLKFKD